MAITEPYLKISDTSGSDVFNLWTGNNIKVMSRGRVIHDIGQGLVEDRVLIRTTDSATSVLVQQDHSTIVDYARKVRLYHEEPERSAAYWLEESAKNEIEAEGRKSLLYKIEIKWLPEGDLNNWQMYGQIGEIIFTRAKWWEYNSDTFTYTDMDFKGGTAIAGTVRGDLDGRLTQIKVNSGTAIEASYWIGIREEGLGYTFFDPLAECEGMALGTDASATVNASYSGGTAIAIDFTSSESMTTRLTATPQDFTGLATAAGVQNMFGEYLVLLSMVTTDTAVCLVQLGGDTAITSNAVRFSGALSQELTEVGYIRFPAYTFRNQYDLNVGEMNMFEIQAQRISGSGKLIIDYAILIPSRHMIKVGPRSNAPPVDGTVNYIYTHPDDSIMVVGSNESGTVMSSFIPFEDTGWNILPNNCLFVFATDQNAGSAAPAATVEISYDARWNYYYVTS